MANRMDLHKILCNMLDSTNVYFQPPENLKISYPAIVYTLDNIDFLFADDYKYKRINRYTLTFITKDPEPSFVDDILKLDYCNFERSYVIDNLNHFIFEIFW